MSHTGKSVIVTGSSRGIGKAIAQKFASEGANVVVSSRTKKEVDATVAEIIENGGKAIACCADMGKPSDCTHLINTCMESFGSLDILVLNAGIAGPAAPVEHCSYESWRETLNINLDSAFICSQLAIPQLRKSACGRIVTVSSCAGVHPFPTQSAYGVSKAGLIMLTRILSAELASAGITVNCILPGAVITDLVKRNLAETCAKMGHDDPEHFLKMMVSSFQMSHFGTPNDVNDIPPIVSFLASEKAKAITGVVVNHGGGWV